MDYAEIIYGAVGGIATITLNRPDRLNAWTQRMGKELRRAVFEAAEDDAVRVIVLTGAGRGFCSGADFSELESVAKAGVSAQKGPKKGVEAEGKATVNMRADFQKRHSYFLAIPKPIIAAINGPAVGLGLIVALYCDLRFASENARFSTAFSRRGLIAEYGISWILPQIVGMPNALDLLFSARMVDAQEALGMGLVNGVFPEEGLMQGVSAYATELATLVSPRSLKAMKAQIYNARFQTLAEATDVADEEMHLSLQSEDFKEGVAHFIEKRTPNFTGK